MVRAKDSLKQGPDHQPEVLLNGSPSRRGSGEPPREKMELQASNYFRFSGRGVSKRARQCGPPGLVGLTKCEIWGPRAKSWLNSILTDSSRPEHDRPGHSDLSSHGTQRRPRARSRSPAFRPDQSISSPPDRFETHDFDVLEKFLPAGNSARIDEVTTQHGVSCPCAGSRLSARCSPRSPTLTSPTKRSIVGRRRRLSVDGEPHRDAGQFRGRARL